MLSKTHTKKLITNQFRRSKVIDCVGELLTRRWNAWHSEKHCVFTAGGERVNTTALILSICRVDVCMVAPPL
jgi:hypothetical protein